MRLMHNRCIINAFDANIMELRRLNHLLILAEEQHFARAASRVRLSQPAFSRSIQALEEEVGIRLFDRKKGDVHVTPAGEYMIERARKLLFEARCLQRDMDLYRGSHVGDLAIGVGPIVAVELMPRVLAELRTAHPHVAMQVEQTNTKQLMDRLFAESLEFIVADARDVRDDNQTDVKVLPGQPVQCFAHARHPLAGKSCTLTEAWEFGVSSVKISDTTNRKIAKALRLPMGQSPVLALQCNNHAVLTSLALSTDTVLISTPNAVRSDLQSGALVCLTVTDMPSVVTRFGIVTLRNRTPSPIAKTAMACIYRVAKQLDSI